MIIFDLDGTLADCEHRLHFVKRKKTWVHEGDHFGVEFNGQYGYQMIDRDGKITKPNWQAFYEACDKDEVIIPVWRMFVDRLDLGLKKNIQIWSGRCESVREKTENWLAKHLQHYSQDSPVLKMRPVGDYTPDDQLKEKWLDEALTEGKKIDFVFDDRPKVVKMWRRRGIFVFDVNQTGEEF